MLLTFNTELLDELYEAILNSKMWFKSYQKILHILEALPMSVAYYLMSTIYTASTLYILTILFDAAYCRILAIDPRFLL